MGRAPKRKGSRWERDVVKLLHDKGGGIWKRIPGSGAMGHFFNDASLNSDVTGKYPWLRKIIRGECKTGYGTSRSLSLKRDWIVKVREEAEEARGYPCLLLKFSDVRDNPDTAKLICFNLDVWIDIVTEVNDLYEEYIELLERLEDDKSNSS